MKKDCKVAGYTHFLDMAFAFRRWRKTPRGKRTILVLGLGIVIVIVNFICGIRLMDGGLLVEYNGMDSIQTHPPYIDRNSEDYIRSQLRKKRLAIFSRIFEKQARRNSLGNQTCQHPRLDLKHDTNKEAFHAMPPLNCSGQTLFYVHNGAVHLNKSVLQGRELGKCMYYGIERVTDDFFTYTQSVERKEEPYDLIISHDFMRIQCSYRSSNREQHDHDDRGVEYFNQRRLLSSPPHHIHDESVTNTSKHSSQNPAPINITHDVMNRNDRFHSDKVAVSPTRKLQELIQKAEDSHENLPEMVNDDEKEPLGVERLVSEGIDSTELYNEIGDTYYEHFMDMMDDNYDFDQFLVQVVPKPQVFERIAKTKKGAHASGMNVLILALDSMSHLSYQRKLPLTYRFLKEELDATMLNGYNIVGDATTAAIIPIMTGKTEVELPEVRKEADDSNHLDVYPLIWNRFKEAGYATMYSEDEPSIGTFNLRFNGFQDEPTDHYMRPFWQAVWESGLRGQSERYCTGATPHHQYLLQYVKDFYVKYSNVSKFVFAFSGELTHWDNNPGEYADKDIVTFLRFLQVKGYLDNTMLVVMGDHGARYSKVRNTVQGKLEERLPMMSVVLPKWFLHEYPQARRALKRNSHSLTTPFDIHETFLDILDLSRLSDSTRPDQRGMSILRNIPENRTCQSAGIDVHWCACLHQIQVSFEDKFVSSAAKSVVSYINSLTNSVRGNCTELTLRRIYSAFMLLPNKQVLKFTKSSDADQREANFSSSIDLDKAHYQITLETEPSMAVYEVTVEVDFRNETYQYHVTPDISRINMYGDQPMCIQKEHPDLRKYCFCRDHLKESHSSNINSSL